MTWAVAWRPLAERDLIDCAAHIAQDNTDAALRFIDAVEETDVADRDEQVARSHEEGTDDVELRGHDEARSFR